MYSNNFKNIASILLQRPHAAAIIKGGSKYPQIRGIVNFYQTNYGVITAAQIAGLPAPNLECQSPIFAFHIHSGNSCSGNKTDEFANSLTHYNPDNCPHLYHAGDLPPLFSSDGNAFLIVLTDRFSVKEIIDKTVIIHSSPDDFTTQPSGNAGEKIACGEIRSLR